MRFGLVGPGMRLPAEPSRHHRDARGMGGSRSPVQHSLANLLLVCGGRLAGVMGCHGRIESDRDWALERGYLITGTEDQPWDVPVTLWSGRRVLLDPVWQFYLPPPDGLVYAR